MENREGPDFFSSQLICTNSRKRQKSLLRSLGVEQFTITMLNSLNPVQVENSVDPDQLASEKPADQDLHCFPTKSMLINGILQVDWI